MLEDVYIFLKAKVHNKETLEMEEVHDYVIDRVGQQWLVVVPDLLELMLLEEEAHELKGTIRELCSTPRSLAAETAAEEAAEARTLEQQGALGAALGIDRGGPPGSSGVGGGSSGMGGGSSDMGGGSSGDSGDGTYEDAAREAEEVAATAAQRKAQAEQKLQAEVTMLRESHEAAGLALEKTVDDQRRQRAEKMLKRQRARRQKRLDGMREAGAKEGEILDEERKLDEEAAAETRRFERQAKKEKKEAVQQLELQHRAEVQMVRSLCMQHEQAATNLAQAHASDKSKHWAKMRERMANKRKGRRAELLAQGKSEEEAEMELAILSVEEAEEEEKEAREWAANEEKAQQRLAKEQEALATEVQTLQSRHRMDAAKVQQESEEGKERQRLRLQTKLKLRRAKKRAEVMAALQGQYSDPAELAKAVDVAVEEALPSKADVEEEAKLEQRMRSQQAERADAMQHGHEQALRTVQQMQRKHDEVVDKLEDGIRTDFQRRRVQMQERLLRRANRAKTRLRQRGARESEIDSEMMRIQREGEQEEGRFAAVAGRERSELVGGAKKVRDGGRKAVQELRQQHAAEAKAMRDEAEARRRTEMADLKTRQENRRKERLLVLKAMQSAQGDDVSEETKRAEIAAAMVALDALGAEEDDELERRLMAEGRQESARASTRHEHELHDVERVVAAETSVALKAWQARQREDRQRREEEISAKWREKRRQARAQAEAELGAGEAEAIARRMAVYDEGVEEEGGEAQELALVRQQLLEEAVSGDSADGEGDGLGSIASMQADGLADLASLRAEHEAEVGKLGKGLAEEWQRQMSALHLRLKKKKEKRVAETAGGVLSADVLVMLDEEAVAEETALATELAKNRQLSLQAAEHAHREMLRQLERMRVAQRDEIEAMHAQYEREREGRDRRYARGTGGTAARRSSNEGRRRSYDDRPEDVHLEVAAARRKEETNALHKRKTEQKELRRRQREGRREAAAMRKKHTKEMATLQQNAGEKRMEQKARMQQKLRERRERKAAEVAARLGIEKQQQGLQRGGAWRPRVGGGEGRGKKVGASEAELSPEERKQQVWMKEMAELEALLREEEEAEDRRLEEEASALANAMLERQARESGQIQQVHLRTVDVRFVCACGAIAVLLNTPSRVVASCYYHALFIFAVYLARVFTASLTPPSPPPPPPQLGMAQLNAILLETGADSLYSNVAPATDQSWPGDDDTASCGADGASSNDGGRGGRAIATGGSGARSLTGARPVLPPIRTSFAAPSSSPSAGTASLADAMRGPASPDADGEVPMLSSPTNMPASPANKMKRVVLTGELKKLLADHEKEKQKLDMHIQLEKARLRQKTMARRKARKEKKKRQNSMYDGAASAEAASAAARKQAAADAGGVGGGGSSSSTADRARAEEREGSLQRAGQLQLASGPISAVQAPASTTMRYLQQNATKWATAVAPPSSP
jgi:hypothetical protein